MAAPSVSCPDLGNYRHEALIWPPLRVFEAASNSEAPANALARFGLALREGAEAITIDVELSRDSGPTVLLGARQSGVNGCRGVASKPRTSTVPLPEVLRWVHGQQCMSFVAAKTPAVEPVVLNEIARANVRHLTRVVARDVKAIERLRRMDSQAHLGLRLASRPPTLDRLLELGAEVLLPRWSLARPNLVRLAHRAGLLVIPWTLNRPEEMQRAILAGVDGIITNDPGKLAATTEDLRRAFRAMPSGGWRKAQICDTIAQLRCAPATTPGPKPDGPPSGRCYDWE